MKSGLWNYLEDIMNFSAPLNDWKQAIGGQNDFAAFQAMLLVATGKYADQIACQARCDRTCAMTVFPRDSTRFDAICSLNKFNSREINADEVMEYRLDLSRLHQAIAEVLGFQLNAFPGHPRRYYLGEYIPFQGVSFPVYISYCNLKACLAGMIKELCAGEPKQFVLLATSRRFLTPATEQLLEKREALFLSLEDELVIDRDGKLKTLRNPVELFLPLFQKEKKHKTAFFPTPPGVKWEDVSIRLVNNHTAAVSIRTVRIVVDYAQMGMAKDTPREPRAMWYFLLKLANGKGVYWHENHRKLKALFNRKYELSKALQTFFRIDDGDPIEWDEESKAYFCRFKIRPEGCLD